MSRRGVAIAVLLLWLAGLGLLARRELFRGDAERLAAAALRVTPGATYYAVRQGADQIGFASSTIDTMAAGFRVNDYFVADLPVAGKLRRGSGRAVVELTRSLRMTAFTLDVQSEAGPLRVTGRPEGDTLLTLAIATGSEPPDTQRVKVSGPMLMPTLVPLAVALTARPRVGRRYTFPVFDPTAMGPRDVTVTIKSESLFVVDDSAEVAAGARRWSSAHRDTVRAWQVVPEGPSGFTGWVDAQGRVVEASQPGFLLQRTAFELAYSNWKLDARNRPRVVAADKDILESTAIAASAPLGRRRIDRLRVRLSNVSLEGFDLAGDRQSITGDTLSVVRERPAALRAAYKLPVDSALGAQFRAELAPEPLLQSESPPIRELATRLTRGERDPRIVAERINRWVHDSLRKEITFGVPNALQVLKIRNGDCNEHTQLYLALARAAGIPARSAAGLAFVDGKFYYHAWPEVYLGTWVAIDPTFGEFPADAAHLRFVIGGLNRQAELLRLIGNLKIDVVK